MHDIDAIAGYALAFRVGERIALSIVVLLVALVVTIGFWKSIQRVDFQLSRDSIGGGGTFVLATPVFALVALIGFAWVTFSHPVEVSTAAAAGAREAQPAAQPSPSTHVVYSVPGNPADADRSRRERNRGVVRTLNCISVPSDAQREALVLARLIIMELAWAPEWGDPSAFRLWAISEVGAPTADARKFFAERSGC